MERDKSLSPLVINNLNTCNSYLSNKTEVNNFFYALFNSGETVNLRFLVHKNNEYNYGHLKVINRFITIKEGESIDEIYKLINEIQNEPYEAYFTPVPRNDNSTTTFSRLNSFFVDIDSKDFKDKESFTDHIERLNHSFKKRKLFPTFIIKTGNGFHYYWILKSEANLTEKEWRKYQESLIYYSDADDRICTSPNDLLRIPYTLNQKNLLDIKESEIVFSNLDYSYSPNDFQHILKSYEKQNEIEEEGKDYEDNLEFKNRVLQNLEEYGKGIFDDYNDFRSLVLACKTEGISYERIDKILNKSNNYHFYNNLKIFNSSKSNGKVTFGTIYHYSKKANEKALKEKLNKISENLTNVEDLLSLLSNKFRFITIVSEDERRKIVNTFLVLLDENKYISVFGKNHFSQHFINYLCVEYLEKNKVKNKMKFFKLLNAYILNDNPVLKIQNIQKSNLSVLKDNKLYTSTNFEKGILITKDNENIEYSKIEPQPFNEVEEIFEKLYGDKNYKLIKAQIISSIVNESFYSKQLFVICGYPSLGKSKTSQLISKIVSNSDIAFNINSLDKKWKLFFQTRTPIVDNVDKDIKKFLNVTDDLAGILTSRVINLNVRFSISGENFMGDVYPILTTTNPEILDYKDTTPLKSRSIFLYLERNEYAMRNIDRLLNDKGFISKCRLHFYHLTEEYLKEKDKIDVSKIENRNKNFFRVLTWIDRDFTKEYLEELNETRNYDDLTESFLQMVEKEKLYNEPRSVKDWTKLFKKFTNNDAFIDDENLNRKLFRYHIDKFVVSDIIGDYEIKKRKKKNTTEVTFKKLK